MTARGGRSPAAVVLAAGEGTRMRSSTPKVLHRLCDVPMVVHVVRAVAELPLHRIVVVVGRAGDEVARAVGDRVDTRIPVELVEQRERRGTGDAAAVALTAFPDDLDVDDDLLVVPGDAPLLRPGTLARVLEEHAGGDRAATLLTARLPDPTGYGRVLRDGHGRVEAIVEEADATTEQRAVDEVCVSVYCFRRGLLAPSLRRIAPDNAQGEYYLTDVVGVLREAGHPVAACTADDPGETAGVNDRAQLAAAEAVLRDRINTRWMLAGVTMTDPARTYVGADVLLDADVTLLPGVILEGRTRVAQGCEIGPDTRLVDTSVGEGARVRQSVAVEAVIGTGCAVGPYASLRPGTRLAEGAHAGSFVEIKNSEIGEGAKVPHLSYVGDAEIGARANLGAGTITANYDGRRKHRTVVGADARIGSDTVLRAPVVVGEGAYTAAGAVVTADVPPGALAKGVPARVDKDWSPPDDAHPGATGGAGSRAGGGTEDRDEGSPEGTDENDDAGEAPRAGREADRGNRE